MSDVRLISKLMKFGVSDDKLNTMDRKAMLDLCAEFILAGKEENPATVAAKGATAAAHDTDFERKRYELELKRYEEEKEFRKAQLKFMEDNQSKQLEERQSVVTQLKNFGEAFRNAAVKMGNEPIDLIPFFDSVEHLFRDLKVPTELRAALIKPYLNEKAQVLVNRLEADRSSSYDEVKRYLLDQFRLVPQFFLEQFNTVVRRPQETFKAYVSRLTLLLNYYLNSRNVTSFALLRDLLVSDRVKSVLHENSLSHILRI